MSVNQSNATVSATNSTVSATNARKIADESFYKALEMKQEIPVESKSVAGKSTANESYNPYFDLEKLKTVGDSNSDNSLSSEELKGLSSFIDLDRDDAVSEAEMDLLVYIAKKDGKNGLNTEERAAVEHVIKLIEGGVEQGHNYQITPETLQSYKVAVDNFLKEKKVFDLDGNGKIDTWETDVHNLGISTNKRKLIAFKKVADSDQDGKISKSEYDRISPFLDINSDGKVERNELGILEYVAGLDKNAGISENELIALTEVKAAFDKFIIDNNGDYAPINERNITAAKNIANKKYTDLTGGLTGGVTGNGAIDMNKNGKIDDFENAAGKMGVSTTNTNFDQMVKIADTDGSKSVLMAEYNAVKDLIDFTGDKAVDKNELALAEYISQLDGKNGIGSIEKGIADWIKNIIVSNNYKLTDNNLATAKTMVKNEFDKLSKNDKKAIDLDKNGKIDDFETKAATDDGITTDTTNIAQMTKIADSNNDGKVSETELNAIKKYFGLNESKKAEKLELDILEELAKVNGKNGVDKNGLDSTETFLADLILSFSNGKFNNADLEETVKIVKDL